VSVDRRTTVTESHSAGGQVTSVIMWPSPEIWWHSDGCCVLHSTMSDTWRSGGWSGGVIVIRWQSDNRRIAAVRRFPFVLERFMLSILRP